MSNNGPRLQARCNGDLNVFVVDTSLHPMHPDRTLCVIPEGLATEVHKAIAIADALNAREMQK